MNEVDAVKSPETNKAVFEALVKRKGQLYGDVWKFGVNAALRISDLLGITMKDARTGKLEIREGKTSKKRTITLNTAAMAVVELRYKQHAHHTYLFEVDSNRAKGQPVSRVSVARAFKEVGDMHSIQVKLGTHSMRKTRGWLMHSSGVDIAQIARVLNHSTPAVTMAYIGLTEQATQDTYRDFVIEC